MAHDGSVDVAKAVAGALGCTSCLVVAVCDWALPEFCDRGIAERDRVPATTWLCGPVMALGASTLSQDELCRRVPKSWKLLDIDPMTSRTAPTLHYRVSDVYREARVPEPAPKLARQGLHAGRSPHLRADRHDRPRRAAFGDSLLDCSLAKRQPDLDGDVPREPEARRSEEHSLDVRARERLPG